MAEKRCNRDWCEDRVMNSLSSDAERLYSRLRMKVDSHGRYWGAAAVVRDMCLPGMGWGEERVLGCLEELEGLRLIVRYEVGAGTRYLALVNWDGRVRTAPKFPPMVGRPAGWLAGEEDVFLAAVPDGELALEDAGGDGVTGSAAGLRQNCGGSAADLRQNCGGGAAGSPLPSFPPDPPLLPSPLHTIAREGGAGGAAPASPAPLQSPSPVGSGEVEVEESSSAGADERVGVLLGGVLRDVNIQRGSELCVSLGGGVAAPASPAPQGSRRVAPGGEGDVEGSPSPVGSGELEECPAGAGRGRKRAEGEVFGAPPSVEAVYAEMCNSVYFTVGDEERFRRFAEDCFEHYREGRTAGGGLVTNWRRKAVMWIRQEAEKEQRRRVMEEAGRRKAARPVFREDIVPESVTFDGEEVCDA